MNHLLFRLLTVLVLALSLTSMTTGQLVAQDVVLAADFANQTDGDCAFKDAGNASVTTGTFTPPSSEGGWTYEKDGQDFKIYNPSGELMATFTGANSLVNRAGPIKDAGSGSPNWGGNWTRP